MTDGLNVKVIVTGTGEIRRASSSCHGAPLDILRDALRVTGSDRSVTYESAAMNAWLCRECGEPCERVLSEPEQFTFSNKQAGSSELPA